jgi:anti-anti-sigma factor
MTASTVDAAPGGELSFSGYHCLVGPPGALRMSVERAGDLVVARLRGELDLHTVAAFAAALEDVCGSCRRLVVDLRGLDFIDSSGLHGLTQLRDGLAPAAQLVLVRGSENVHRTFEIVGLDRELTFVDALD